MRKPFTKEKHKMGLWKSVCFNGHIGKTVKIYEEDLSSGTKKKDFIFVCYSCGFVITLSIKTVFYLNYLFCLISGAFSSEMVFRRKTFRRQTENG